MHREKPTIQLLPTILIIVSNVHASTTNFCGSDWNSASTDCQNRQPCPGGTDEECDSPGICWADTLCDTTKGDGILFDKDNPQHQRFCGNSWNDAADNCSAERHCASGDSSECPNGEACYSFLSGCNYVDMIVGSKGGDTGGDDEESGGPPRLDGNSPMRSNWCGSDWNDAIAHCTDTSHWCPSGSDSDCPAGKICFAGTDCKFVDDLHPTESPTPAPSTTPTEMPLVYETIENTRFCGSGWEDAQSNCQISRHCPQGKNSECPAGMTCFSWMSGCNILDMLDYLDNYGVEIYGADRNELNPSGESGGSASSNSITDSEEIGSGSNSSNYEWPAPDTESTNSTGVQPSLSTGVWTPQPAPVEKTPPPMWTAAPVEPTPTNAPAEPPSDGFYPEHHVFCGESWFDAQSKCSEETFCSDGAATHVCAGEKEFCWVGITACDAGDWLLAKDSPSPIISSLAPISDMTPAPIDSAALEDDMTMTPIAAPIAVASLDEGSTAPIENKDIFPTFTPSVLSGDMTDAPAESTIPSDSDTATEPDRFSMKQSFCAESYIHLIQECEILETCNTKQCPSGLTCFKNVLCDRPANTAPGSITIDDDIETPAPAPAIPESGTSIPSPSPVSATNSPVLALLLTKDTVMPTITQVTLSPETRQPSQQPTIFSLSEEEVAQRMSNPNNYCARSLQEILTSCSYALKTCNADDPMCGLGTNCFGNIICPSPTNAPSAVVPVIITTLEPIAVGVDDAATRNPATQSFCAESEDLVQSTCATGFTCNEGPHTCPFGTSCFTDVVCEALQNNGDSSALPSLNTGTSTPAARIGESPQTTEFTGNYCAESEDTLQSTCEEALVCNDGFGTCPFGTFCFTNVVCKALQVTNDESAAISQPSSDEEGCDNLCLKPIDAGDCDYILSMGLDILPCTGVTTEFEQETSMDQVCSGTGRCGTSLDLNNCDTNEDLYMRVDASSCIEAGVGKSGVILTDSSQTVSTSASITAPETPESFADTKAPPSSTPAEPNTNDASSEQPKDESEDIVYPWDNPSKNSIREDQDKPENQAEIDSWWILQEAGAVRPTIHVLTFLSGMLLLLARHL